jgi:hypothetical protein
MQLPLVFGLLVLCNVGVGSAKSIQQEKAGKGKINNINKEYKK